MAELTKITELDAKIDAELQTSQRRNGGNEQLRSLRSSPTINSQKAHRTEKKRLMALTQSYQRDQVRRAAKRVRFESANQQRRSRAE